MKQPLNQLLLNSPGKHETPTKTHSKRKLTSTVFMRAYPGKLKDLGKLRLNDISNEMTQLGRRSIHLIMDYKRIKLLRGGSRVSESSKLIGQTESITAWLWRIWCHSPNKLKKGIPATIEAFIHRWASFKLERAEGHQRPFIKINDSDEAHVYTNVSLSLSVPRSILNSGKAFRQYRVETLTD